MLPLLTRSSFVRGALRLGLQVGAPVLAVLLVAAAAQAGDAETAFERWGRGDLAGALAASEAAVARPDAGATAWKVRGFLLSKGGRKEDAAAAYRHAVGADPADAVARNNLGAVLLDLGRVEEALVELEAAVQRAPGYADARNNRGVALERLGRLDEAVTSYRTAATDARTHAAAMNNLGAIAWRRGRREKAQGAFARAVQLDPELLVPSVNLALVGPAKASREEETARLRAAAGDASRPLALRARLLAALAAREVEASRWEEARRLYLEAIALRPEDAALLNNVGVVEDRLGLDREAILHFEAALAEDATLLVARNNTGVVHVHRGQLDAAADVFREVLAESPSFWRAHYNLGVVLAAQGRLTEARTSLREAAALRPRDGAVRYNLAIVEARLGSGVAMERRGYEEALALDPGLAEAHLSLGGLLADPNTPETLRDERGARTHIDRFLALARPTDDDGREQARGWLAWLDYRATSRR